jgi:hypothetical protein
LGVILSEAVFQAERRACPERSRRDLARSGQCIPDHATKRNYPDCIDRDFHVTRRTRTLVLQSDSTAMPSKNGKNLLQPVRLGTQVIG